MNPLAEELNATIRRCSEPFFGVLSGLGRELFFPKGILTQTAEAREDAHRLNATIGEARAGGEAMHLGVIMDRLEGLSPDEALRYAPATGNPALRRRWLEDMLRKNPSLEGKRISLPVVTSGITHGLTLTGDLFVDTGDHILLPDHFWGNYRMIYGTRKGAELVTYPFFSDGGGFNLAGLSELLQDTLSRTGKAVVLLNFPNNPTGYSIKRGEAEELAEALVSLSGPGRDVVVVCDDAYFGLFYEEEALPESIFSILAGRGEHLFPVKLDGATKEEYAWGIRVGFMTFSVEARGGEEGLYRALEKKAGGDIRGTISNCSQLSQSVLLSAMCEEEFDRQRLENYEIMKSRALAVKRALEKPEYDEIWEPYPFNAGYFMCLRLKELDGEELRQRLLREHGVGLIAQGRDVRIAFSCLELDDIPELFDIVFRCAKDMISQEE